MLLCITHTVIAPGPIADTEGYDRLSTGTAEDKAKAAAARVPLGRYGSVKDIANASVFLFSDAANWITGQIIVSLILSVSRLPKVFWEYSMSRFFLHACRLSTVANFIRKCFLFNNLLVSSRMGN